MSNLYLTTDSSVVTFISNQNLTRPINSTDPFMPAPDNNGIAGMTADNVIAMASVAAAAPAVTAGSGFNTVILKGAHSSLAAANGQPDSFSFNVDGSGLITLHDNNSGQSVTVSNAAFLIFNDAATTSDAAGNVDFSSIFYLGNASQSEIVRLYTAALGRQPDLGGVEYYAHQLTAGFGFQQIAGEFMASPEFINRYGARASDTQFIDNLYANVLHRAPIASELAFYQAALSNAAAGSIVDSTNPVMWSRGQELVNFTNSPECQNDVSGFVINTAQGGYADSPVLLPAQTVVNQAGASGYLNTALLSPSAITAAGYRGLRSADGSIDVAIPLGPAAYNPYNIVWAKGNNQTVILSSTVAEVEGSGSTTAYGDAPGGNAFDAHGADTFFLSGTKNTIFSASLPIPTVYGFTQGDSFTLDIQGFLGCVTTILTPSASAPINGKNLMFNGEVLGPNNVYLGTQQYAINVGPVADDSPETMAKAANKVYLVGDIPYAGDFVSVPQQGPEGLYFFGTDPKGNSVVYGWFGAHQDWPADVNNDHQVDASAFSGGALLIGLPASSLTPDMFK